MDNILLQKSIRDSLNTFLSEFPLYKNLEVFTIYAGLDERDISFDSFCEIDKLKFVFGLVA